MSVLLESPLAVGAIGLLLVTMAAIPFFQTRSRGALGLLGAAVLLTIGGVAFERAYLTPREQVRDALSGLFGAIRSNDLPGVLRSIDVAATDVQADAQTLMPMFRVDGAGEGGEVAVDFSTDPPVDGTIATATLKPLIRVRHTKSGATGAYFDKLEIDLVRRGDRWLVSAYRPAKNWRDGASQLGR
ncbi:hypothetical protein Pla108_05320 [Botrimarina colliarenosi]|uniref:Tim44-like domain protein n=1 Tax=Botrimarina colliarenosi TaxID=2528001 RepID=A0A5C6AIZ3_9BACT|nr:hypothetical protein [Botrimarina colliarenosi]TWT99589.1 hypothetical protein Pla108_05320 [Botrimarina colliarenosi]